MFTQLTTQTKAERYGGKPRSKLRDSDFVLADERKFPVMTEQDVRDAVSSWGRYRGSASFESFKRRLIRLARRKGLQSALPASWKVKELSNDAIAELLVTFKQPNFGARVGQTIAGALARGPGGRFVRGSGAPLSGRELIDALTKKPKGGKRGAKKLNDAQQAALGEKAGIDSEDLGALKKFAKGGTIAEGDAKRLVNLGLAERGKDGTLRMTSNSRGLLRALQKGDQQAARDALSRGRDRAATAAERASKPAKAPKASGGKGGKGSDAAAKRQQREQQRIADETTKITDRVEELESLLKQDDTPTPFQRTQQLNRLDDLSRRLERIGGNEQLQARVDALRKQLEASAKELSRLTVYKQADGSYRWLAVTSNAFEDRDGEIVSTKALEADVDRADDPGPLRWWHVGKVRYTTPLDWQTSVAGTGIDIGTCDFRAVHGRMLIEAGTFKAGAPVESIAADPAAWQMSIGFSHPPNEPDANGTYHNIRVFERSLLPKGRAANPFTAIAVSNKEANMASSLKDKWDSFVSLFGGDEAKAKQFAAATEETQKEIEAAGVAFKEEQPTQPTQPEATIKAEGDAPVEAEAAEEEVQFIGDMTAEEFVALLQQALAPLMESMSALGKAATEAQAATDAAAKELATLKQSREQQSEAQGARLDKIETAVKELQGDAPSARGFRASQDTGTITQKQMTPPQPVDDIARLAAFMFGANGKTE